MSVLSMLRADGVPHTGMGVKNLVSQALQH